MNCGEGFFFSHFFKLSFLRSLQIHMTVVCEKYRETSRTLYPSMAIPCKTANALTLMQSSYRILPPPPGSLLSPVTATVLFLPLPQAPYLPATTNLFSTSIILSSEECYINGIASVCKIWDCGFTQHNYPEIHSSCCVSTVCFFSLLSVLHGLDVPQSLRLTIHPFKGNWAVSSVCY